MPPAPGTGILRIMDINHGKSAQNLNKFFPCLQMPKPDIRFALTSIQFLSNLHFTIPPRIPENPFSGPSSY
jgi:hypothetical protein